MVMYTLVFDAEKFGDLFCGGDTRDTSVRDKLSGIHVEQKWKRMKEKFSVLGGVEMAHHILECNLPLAASLN